MLQIPYHGSKEKDAGKKEVPDTEDIVALDIATRPSIYVPACAHAYLRLNKDSDRDARNP